MRAMSSAVSSRWVRSVMRPIVRASMNSTSPSRSLSSPARRPLDRNHSHAEICVEWMSCPGSATMQSTGSAATMFLRISPSPDWFEDIDPLARTKPSEPRGRDGAEVRHRGEVRIARRGMPYTQRWSSRIRSPPQSETLKGGLARM